MPGTDVSASGCRSRQSWGIRVMQAGEAAGAATVAGRHVDAHPLAAGLDRLLGAGILAQQAIEALTGLTACLYPDPGLHLTAEPQVQRPGGTGSGAAATVAALAAGGIGVQARSSTGVPAMGVPTYSGWSAGLSRPLGQALKHSPQRRHRARNCDSSMAQGGRASWQTMSGLREPPSACVSQRQKK